MQRLVILISGAGSNMIAIARSLGVGQSSPPASSGVRARVVAVLANRADAPGLQWARDAGLPCEVIEHRGFADRALFDTALAERIAACSPDWILLAGFMRILGATFIRRFAGRIVNIHPSLLPAFAGLDTHQRAIDAGVRLHGATVHLVDEGVDSGMILAQAALRVRDGESALALRERVLRLEHQLYPRVVGWLISGRLRAAAHGGCVLDVPAAERLIVEPA